MTGSGDTHPVHSIRAAFSILLAIGAAAIAAGAAALYVAFAVAVAQAMTRGIGIVGLFMVLGVFVLALIASMAGAFLGWTSYRDPLCKKFFPVLGLAFNGLSLLAIGPGVVYLSWILIRDGLR